MDIWAGEGWAGRGSPSYLGRGATGDALSNSLSPETLRGALEGRHNLGDPSEPRGPLDYALPRATVCRPACECWTGSALTAVLQAWALGQHSRREPGAPAPFIQGHPATSPTGSPCFSQGKGRMLCLRSDFINFLKLLHFFSTKKVMIPFFS